MEIQDAREKGFVQGASIESAGRHRVLTSGRIKKQGEDLLAWEQSAFYIYQKGEWKARVLSTKNMSHEKRKEKRKETRSH